MRTVQSRVVVAFALALAMSVSAGAGQTKGTFTWTTDSAEAKTLLVELQQRIESFQFGPQSAELARKITEADPEFAMGHYYLYATTQQPADRQPPLDRALELAKEASDGERRFIETMAHIRDIQAITDPRVQETAEGLEALAADYPQERLVQVILGQLYQATNQAEKAHRAFLRCEEIGPSSPRAKAFLANYDLLEGDYAAARAAFEAVESSLPTGTSPFAIHYGIAFSHLYEGDANAALASLKTYLEEYRKAGLIFGPDVFIWNSIARINLERGRLEEAMKAYEKGYEGVPGSSLPEDQKALWEGRLQHGRSRVLARMGKHEEAWAIAEQIKAMIEEGGEEAEQYWPQWHYLAGYLKLEADDPKAAIVHLEKANPNDPFQTLLLARAYERAGRKDDARQAYEKVVASQSNGLERALAYPEAKKKLAS
jgi:tetratricopeptide (TPR) repeat protein